MSCLFTSPVFNTIIGGKGFFGAYTDGTLLKSVSGISGFSLDQSQLTYSTQTAICEIDGIPGKYVATGLYGSSDNSPLATHVFFSTDKNNWIDVTPLAYPGNKWNGIAYGDGIFMLVGYYPNPVTLISTDGQNWSLPPTPKGGFYVEGVTYCKLTNSFFITGWPDGSIYRTADRGNTWTTPNASYAGYMRDLASFDNYVYAGNIGGHDGGYFAYIFESTDGGLNFSNVSSNRWGGGKTIGAVKCYDPINNVRILGSGYPIRLQGSNPATAINPGIGYVSAGVFYNGNHILGDVNGNIAYSSSGLDGTWTIVSNTSIGLSKEITCLWSV